MCLIFWLIFSILGVNLFGGKFGRCVDIKSKQILPSVCPKWLKFNDTVEYDQNCFNKNSVLYQMYATDRNHCSEIKRILAEQNM